MANMMCMLPAAPQHEGTGILPSLSNGLHAMRTSNKHEDGGGDNNAAD